MSEAVALRVVCRNTSLHANKCLPSNRLSDLGFATATRWWFVSPALRLALTSRCRDATRMIPVLPLTPFMAAGAVQTLPPDGSVAVPLYSAVQLQRGESLVGDASQIRAVLSHDSSAAAPIETQVPLAPSGISAFAMLHDDSIHAT